MIISSFWLCMHFSLFTFRGLRIYAICANGHPTEPGDGMRFDSAISRHLPPERSLERGACV
nr:MAG TPA: hypothetical protein [Caudoviricetes sp.]